MAEIQQSSGSGHSISKVRRRKSSVRIDMTPMVDLAFLLLTFFILTSSLQKSFIMKVAMPDNPDPVHEPPKLPSHRVLTIVLGENDKVYWYHGIVDPKVVLTSFSQHGIRKVLLTKNAEIQNMWVLIKPSPKSRYKNIVDILDEMTIAQIANFTLVKITPEDERLIGVRSE